MYRNLYMALADFKVFSWDIGLFSWISGLFLIECSKFVEIIGRFQGLFMACVLFVVEYMVLFMEFKALFMVCGKFVEIVGKF